MGEHGGRPRAADKDTDSDAVRVEWLGVTFPQPPVSVVQLVTVGGQVLKNGDVCPAESFRYVVRRC